MKDTPPQSTTVLSWPKRLLSADDLRRHWTGQRELVLLPRTVVTPLAADELRAKGVRVVWQLTTPVAPTQATWIYVQEKHDAMISAAINALDHDGIALTLFEIAPAGWQRKFADSILTVHGGIAFSGDPATVCCIANKIAGIRAVTVANHSQVLRAQKSLGANLFAIEWPGRTFFELRQMLRTIASQRPECRGEMATVLQELDGHAHR